MVSNPSRANRTLWTGDHWDNLQLLCVARNSMKVARSQEVFISKLKPDENRVL